MSGPAAAVQRVRERVAALQEQLRQLEEAAASLEAAGDPAGPSPEAMRRLADENTELATRLTEAEEMNSAMMSMYVSSFQLHASLDPEQVVRTLHEVVINFVGGEEFAILLRADEGDELVVASGESWERYVPGGRAAPQGVVGAVLASAEPYVHAADGPPRDQVLAAVPLAVGGRCVGAVVIFKLLQQKERLMQGDVELLHLVGPHAATALLNAHAHQRVERKLRTLEELLGMLGHGQPGAEGLEASPDLGE